MKNRAIVSLMAALLVCLVSVSAFALEPYSQDFESLSTSSTTLGDDGWLVFANVFGPDWAYWYGYGVFPAPNNYDSPAFSLLGSGEGGATQGLQQLVILSDYNNADHAAGAFIEANVFQEQAIAAGDVGETWVFDFDAKMGDLAGGTTALAFIKTLNPAAGYATTNFITLDMTSIPSTWGSYSLQLFIDGSLDGQILQIGFSSTATLYEPSGVFYDNVNFYITGAVATEEITLDGVKSLYR